MKQQEIAGQDLQALRMIGYVARRFEADAGFPMPGLSVPEISETVADEFDTGPVDETRLESLQRLGLLSRRGLSGGRGYYSLTPFGAFAASNHVRFDS